MNNNKIINHSPTKGAELLCNQNLKPEDLIIIPKSFSD